MTFDMMVDINPLTLELNLSAQWPPAEIFYWGFYILMHAFRKKSVSHGLFLQI
jgi:hypothetical protein